MGDYGSDLGCGMVLLVIGGICIGAAGFWLLADLAAHLSIGFH